MDNLYAQIDEKRKILRREYGGMMTIEQLKKEIGYYDNAHAKHWAADVGLDRTHEEIWHGPAGQDLGQCKGDVCDRLTTTEGRQADENYH